ncbi:hypothetical protein PG990_009891 [Apiospora arundinis]
MGATSKLNTVYLVYFILHIPILFCVDLVAFYPPAWYAATGPLAPLGHLRTYYLESYKDQFFQPTGAPSFFRPVRVPRARLPPARLGLGRARPVLQDRAEGQGRAAAVLVRRRDGADDGDVHVGGVRVGRGARVRGGEGYAYWGGSMGVISPSGLLGKYRAVVLTVARCSSAP